MRIDCVAMLVVRSLLRRYQNGPQGDGLLEPRTTCLGPPLRAMPIREGDEGEVELVEGGGALLRLCWGQSCGRRGARGDAGEWGKEAGQLSTIPPWVPVA